MAARVVTRVTPEVINNTPPPTVIETESKPAQDETFLPPPGMTIEDVIEKPKAPEKPDDGKLHWDFSELLQSGTLGNLVENLHEAIAAGTGWDGWKLKGNEKGQFDTTLGIMLKPLLQKAEYIPLVIGILNIAMIETNHAVGYMKYNKEKKEQEEAEEPKAEIPQTVTTTSPVISPLPPVVTTNPQGQRVSLGGEIMQPSEYDTGPARDSSGNLLDANLPPLRRSDVVPGGAPLPPIHPSQLPQKPPRLQ